jgi:hypothetical protein
VHGVIPLGTSLPVSISKNTQLTKAADERSRRIEPNTQASVDIFIRLAGNLVASYFAERKAKRAAAQA